MDTAHKHFKFINSKTGNVIYYHSLSASLPMAEMKAQLEKIKARVAVDNGLYHQTIYWEEVRDDQ